MRRKALSSSVFAASLLLLFLLVAPAFAVTPVYVDDDFTVATPGWGVTHFMTVQDGINAVDAGGVVNVAAGLYEEQLEIAKDLQLVGAGVGSSTLRSPLSLTLSFPSGSYTNYPIVYVHDTGDAQISGFTVDGAGRGNGNYRFCGLGFRNAGGTVQGCEIIDVRDNPISGGQHGVAIYALADDGNPRSLSVADNTISGFQKNGMALIGADLSVDVASNDVLGAGAIAFIAQNGIQLSSGATGTLTGNNVTGFAYTPATWASTALLIWSTSGSVAAADNVVGEAQVGIWYIDASGDVLRNTVTNTVAGMGATPYWWCIVADPGSAIVRQPAPQPVDAPTGPAQTSRGVERAPALLTSTVSGNRVDGGGNGTGIEADALGTETLDFTAEENGVVNCTAAFSLYKEAGATLNGVLFNNSADGSNSLGLENATGVLQDASGNWWGSNDAATVAAAITGGDVDYTPWLGSGTDTEPDVPVTESFGFQGDFATLFVDDDSPQSGSVDRINEAVALVSGSTVNLAPGSYTNSAQVVIDKNVSMVGAGAASTAIGLSFDTGASGDARAWYLVQPGFSFDVSGVTFDGTGHLVYQGVRNKGAGSFTNCVFTEIKYNPSGPHYSGVAVAAFGDGPVNFSGCTFSEIGRVGVLYYGPGVNPSTFDACSYTGKGVGDWLDYALDISAGADVTVTNCMITGNRGVASSDGSTSAAILVTTYYGPGTTALVTHNTLAGNTTGIAAGYDGTDTATVEAHYNAIYGNDYGVESTAPTVDALSNWWGDASGPYHPTLNPGGLGNEVSDNVLFDPMMTAPHEISLTPDYQITTCEDPVTYTFHLDQAGAPQEIRGYEVVFTIPPSDAVISDPTPTGDFTELPYLSSVGSTSFYTLEANGQYTVSAAILGGETGATGSGDLFSFVVTPVSESTPIVNVESLKLRDPDNLPLGVGGVGVAGSIQIDCTPPTMEAIAEAEGVCYNTAPAFSNFGFDDDVNLDSAEYQIDALGWNFIFSAIDTFEWNDDGWELPGFAGLSEGSHTVNFRVTDDAGNANGEGTPDTYSWQFVKDTTAPDAPSGFSAMPGYNKVHLSWVNPTGDASFVGVEIRRVAWGDYPQYGTPGPAGPGYPASHAEGVLVSQETGETYSDAVTPRDIYYYAAFSYDCAGNYSVADVGAQDRSTSYWLGDINPATTGDGSINILDLAPFSITFGVAQGGAGWNPEADFGPTDDYTRFGVPEPDDIIDFEDLMIFAMNYGNVSPAGASVVPLLVEGKEVLSDLVSFRLVEKSRDGNTVTYAVVMENEATQLKGVSIDLDYGIGGEVVAAEPSGLLAGMGDAFFGTVPRGMGKVNLSIAALGVERRLDVSGEIAIITVRSEHGVAPLRFESLDVRDMTNDRQNIEVQGEPMDAAYVPTTSAVFQNTPNPFNPTTLITYDVATEGAVTLKIFDVAGRLVRTLVNEHKPVGRHQVQWDGRDAAGNGVHTGVYFYRLNTPDYMSPAKKMLLLK